MALDKNDIVKQYVARSMESEREMAVASSISRSQSTPERVYSSSLPELERTVIPPSMVSFPKNRKATRRKISPFTIVLFLISAAVISVLYISNILTVGRLLSQINKMQAKHQQILNDQEMLKAQLNRLASLDRIQQIAHTQLNLINPKQAPVWIHIDQEKAEEIEKVLRQHTETKQ